MPDRKFSATFRPARPSVETTPQAIVLTPIAEGVAGQARYNHLEHVPFHAATAVTSATPADCYLQIWELDYYQTQRFLQNEESDLGPRRNQLIATFPGVVVREGRRFRFRPTADPLLATPTVDPMKGRVTIALRPVGRGTDRNYEIPLAGFETVLELAATLRTSLANRDYERMREIPPHQVRNVEASLRRQIAERGGFAIAFVADYRPAANNDANEGEFHKQAEGTIDVLPFFCDQGGELAMGWHWINDYRTIPDHISRARDAAHAFLELAEDEEAPRVSLLAIFCHGLRTKLKIANAPAGGAAYNAPGSLRVDRVPAFVDGIREHVTYNLVIPIFACSAGRGNVPNPDSSFGRAFPCEELAGDSLAWVLYHELRRRGIGQPTLWCHTTAQHCTRNPYLRVISRHGSADFINLLLRHPRATSLSVDPYRHVFTYNAETQPALIFRIRLHNANLLRAISLQNALYLPWRWNGGQDATIDTPGFDREANRQARVYYDEIRSLMPASVASEDEAVVFEDATRAFITGPRHGLADAQLSEHFRYSDLRDLITPFRIQVQLMKYVQLLRYRANRGMTPREVLENGEGMALEASPNTPANRQILREKAAGMVTEGLFTSSAMVGERLYVSHSGVQYDATWSYIVGKLSGFPDPYLTRALPYRAFHGLMRTMHLSRQLVLRFQGLIDDLATDFMPQAVLDGGDTIEIDAGIHAADLLRAAREYCRRGLLRRAEYGSPASRVRISI